MRDIRHRRTLTKDNLVELCAGHIVDLDGVELLLEDIGIEAIADAMLIALKRRDDSKIEKELGPDELQQ